MKSLFIKFIFCWIVSSIGFTFLGSFQSEASLACLSELHSQEKIFQSIRSPQGKASISQKVLPGDAEDSTWVFLRKGVTPRGGTSKGTEVQLDDQVPKSWARLQEGGLSQYERDRRAIYSLEGSYKTSFEFLETVLMDTDRKIRDVPYASWSTEFVKVIEDRGDFIFLQHIMVMFFVGEDGKVSGPHVIKHWGQSWQWEGKSQWFYRGDKTWSVEDVKKSQGSWIWTVFQVDDSPRYSGVGSWRHAPSASVFETLNMSRPLPRREHSVRSDYKILLGQDTLLVTPQGWFHEQRNFKQKNPFKGGELKPNFFLARELGYNSYRRIKDFDFSEGEAYWKDSQFYWTDVRAVWDEAFQQRKTITLLKSVDGRPLYSRHFENSYDEKVLNMGSEERKRLIRELIEKYLKK